MKTKLYIAAFLLIVGISLPQMSHASYVTDSKAIKITDSTYLFTIDFQLGFEKYGVSLPAFAARSESDKGLSFSVVDGSGEAVRQAKTTGMILGKGPLTREGQYKVTKGAAGKFTLFGIVQVPESYTAETMSVEVTSLPFTLTTSDEEISNGFSSGERQQFTVALDN